MTYILKAYDKDMKFLIEPGPEPRCMVLHFDVPIEGLLPRLVDFHERDEPHDTNPHIMVKYKIATPKKNLSGIELIKPITRYSMGVVVGKAFLIQDTLMNLVNKLEIIMNNDEWGAWMSRLSAETQVIQQQTNQKNDEQINKLKKDLEEKLNELGQTIAGAVRKAAPKRKGTSVRNRRKLGS